MIAERICGSTHSPLRFSMSAWPAKLSLASLPGPCVPLSEPIEQPRSLMRPEVKQGSARLHRNHRARRLPTFHHATQYLLSIKLRLQILLRR